MKLYIQLQLAHVYLTRKLSIAEGIDRYRYLYDFSNYFDKLQVTGLRTL